MAEPKYVHIQSGQAVYEGDINLFASEAALADDRTLAEVLRLAPFDGTNVTRAIIPYGFHPAATVVNVKATVSASGGADGSVQVYPFRAIIGSRTAVGTDPLANWRDIRSTVFAPAGGFQSVPLAANASGQPRWDLVYATFGVDVQGTAVARKIKDPTTGNITVPNVSVQVIQTITISVVAGTPGATPAFPPPPSDTYGFYAIPLAWVLVTNGHSSTTVIFPGQVRLCAEVITASGALGVSTLRPANGNDKNLSPSTLGAWVSFTTRPECFLPRTMVGGKQLFGIIEDLATFANGAVVDDSVDWRNRYFRVTAYASTGSSSAFASSRVASYPDPNPFLPIYTCFAQSFIRTAAGGALFSLQLVFLTHTTYPLVIAAGDIIGLYVDSASGQLKYCAGANANNYRMAFWLEATAPFPNQG